MTRKPDSPKTPAADEKRRQEASLEAELRAAQVEAARAILGLGAATALARRLAAEGETADKRPGEAGET